MASLTLSSAQKEAMCVMRGILNDSSGFVHSIRKSQDLGHAHGKDIELQRFNASDAPSSSHLWALMLAHEQALPSAGGYGTSRGA